MIEHKALSEYILKAKKKKFTDAQIKQQLIKAGWQEHQIDDVLDVHKPKRKSRLLSLLLIAVFATLLISGGLFAVKHFSSTSNLYNQLVIDTPTQHIINSWVSKNNLSQQQDPVFILNLPERNIQVFSVSYGPAQDCMAGCFYAQKTGIRNGDKIAWIEDYQLDETDEYLFTEEFYEQLKTGYGYSYRVSDFDEIFASHVATPVNKLQILVEYAETDTKLRDLLLANPTVQSHPELLNRLETFTDGHTENLLREKYVQQQRDLHLQEREFSLSEDVENFVCRRGLFTDPKYNYKSQTTQESILSDYLATNQIINATFDNAITGTGSSFLSSQTPVKIQIPTTIGFGEKISFSVANETSKAVVADNIEIFLRQGNQWYLVYDSVRYCMCPDSSHSRILQWSSPITANSVIVGVLSPRIEVCNTEFVASTERKNTKTQISGYLPRGNYRLVVDVKYRPHKGIGFYSDKHYEDFVIE